ncbi:MAG: DUF2085 domain-containing protein, partial [Anaerolineales bacterium]
MDTVKETSREESNALADWLNSAISNHWMLVITLSFGLYVGLPFLAPVFKQLGLDGFANGIYFLYSFLCHQYPQRSFFLFGQNSSYSLETIQLWQDTSNPLLLGRFIGNSQLGWKVAWSDRMVSMFSSIPIIGWLWYPFRRKIKPLSIWGFLLFLVPMGLDGITHIISDFSGLGNGFRSTNTWLQILTGSAFPAEFYSGTQLASFNSSMRLVTGVLFGIGVVWFFFPHLDILFQKMKKYLEIKQDQISGVV